MYGSCEQNAASANITSAYMLSYWLINLFGRKLICVNENAKKKFSDANQNREFR